MLPKKRPVGKVIVRFYSPRRLPEVGTVSTVCGGRERVKKSHRKRDERRTSVGWLALPCEYGIIPSIPGLVLL